MTVYENIPYAKKNNYSKKINSKNSYSKNIEHIKMIFF